MAGSRLQVSDKGKPYMQLANALKYQKSYDPSCSCKKDGETWARALQKAERMLAAHKSDVLVTQEVADRLSRAGTGEAKSAEDHSQEHERADGHQSRPSRARDNGERRTNTSCCFCGGCTSDRW
jgi:hypothetical protein